MHAARLVAATGAVVGILALTACAAVSRTVVESETDSWTLLVSPSISATACAGDPAVVQTIEGPSLPSAGLTVQLTSDAGSVDAERVADCYEEALGNGEITIFEPAK